MWERFSISVKKVKLQNLVVISNVVKTNITSENEMVRLSKTQLISSLMAAADDVVPPYANLRNDHAASSDDDTAGDTIIDNEGRHHAKHDDAGRLMRLQQHRQLL